MRISVIAICCLLLAAPARAGLLNSDSADPVAPQHAEIELNGSYTIDKAQSSGVTAKCHSTDGDLTVTAGLAQNLDIAVTLPITFDSREKIGGTLARRSNGLNDLSVGLKYRFLNAGGLKVAIRPDLLLPTGTSSEELSDGRLGLGGALLATQEFADGTLLLHLNAGYLRHNYRHTAVRATTRADIITASVAIEGEVITGLTLAADIGLATATDKTHDTPPVCGLIGATYAISKRLDCYLGGKVGLTNSEDDFTARFGAVYKF